MTKTDDRMAAHDRIELPRSEGLFSRQAHADLPPGTYERERGREGFSGATTHVYHVPAGANLGRIDQRVIAADTGL